jgi:hypothetical protein
MQSTLACGLLNLKRKSMKIRRLRPFSCPCAILNRDVSAVWPRLRRRSPGLLERDCRLPWARSQDRAGLGEKRGLAVFRHQHARQGSFYAFKPELDAWRQARRGAPETPAPGRGTRCSRPAGPPRASTLRCRPSYRCGHWCVHILVRSHYGRAGTSEPRQPWIGRRTPLWCFRSSI